MSCMFFRCFFVHHRRATVSATRGLAVWPLRVLAGICFGGIVSPLLAQTPAPTPAPLPAKLATVTTDTGTFAPVRNWGDYTPDMCRAAVVRTFRELRNSKTVLNVLDTIAPEHDTIGAGGIAAVARACALHFWEADTTVRGRFALLDLAVAAGMDSVVLPTVARRLALERADTVTYDTLMLKTVALLVPLRVTVNQEGDHYGQWTVPLRVALADSLVGRQLDSMGPNHMMADWYAHWQIRLAVAPGSAQWLKEIHAMQWASVRIPGTDWGDNKAFRELSSDGFVNSSSPAGAAWVDGWCAELAFLANEDTAAIPGELTRMLDYRKMMLQNKSMGKSFESPTSTYKPSLDTSEFKKILVSEYVDGGVAKLKAAPYPALQADAWCVVGQRCVMHGGTLSPPPGQVVMYVGLSPYVAYGAPGMAHDNDGPGPGFTYEQPAMFIRRMLAKYGKAGLQVTVVVPGIGTSYVDGGGVDTLQEAERARWYVQDYLHLPVNVLFEAPRFTPRFPEPDGRRFRINEADFATRVDSRSKNLPRSGRDINGFVELVGKDGKYVFTGGDFSVAPFGGLTYEQYFDRYLPKALGMAAPRETK